MTIKSTLFLIFGTLFMTSIISNFALGYMINNPDPPTLTPESQTLIDQIKPINAFLPYLSFVLSLILFFISVFPWASPRPEHTGTSPTHEPATTPEPVQPTASPVTEKKPVSEERYHNRFEAILDEDDIENER